MKRETSPSIELDNLVALRSKSYTFRYGLKNQNKKEYNIHLKTRSS